MTMNYHNYNSSSRFEMVVEIANIALDEFKTHHISRNYTGLVQRYYQLVEEDYGGRWPVISQWSFVILV